MCKVLNEADRVEFLARKQENNNRTALHLTIYNMETNKALDLIRAGSDVNAVDYISFTPLHAAVLMGDVAIVEALLNKKADMNMTIAPRRNFVSSSGHPDLIFPEIKMTPLQLAMFGCPELTSHTRKAVIETLLEFGAIIDKVSKAWMFALNNFKLYKDCTQGLFLLAAGPNPQKKPFEDPDLQAFAKFFNIVPRETSFEEIDMEEVLSTLGTGLNGRLEKDGDTALHIALIHNQKLALQLIAKDIPLNIPGKDKLTVLEILQSQKPSRFRNLCLALIEINKLNNSIDKAITLTTHTCVKPDLNNGLTASLIDIKTILDNPVKQSVHFNPLLPNNNPPAAASAIGASAAAAAGAGAGASAAAGSRAKNATVDLVSEISTTTNKSEGNIVKSNKALEAIVLNIFDLLNIHHANSSEMSLDPKEEHESELIEPHLETIKQSIFYELGGLLIQHHPLFPMHMDTAKNLLKRIPPNHVRFEKANALCVKAMDIAKNTFTSDKKFKIEKLELLFNAETVSEHSQIIGHLMADVLEHDLYQREIRDITEVSGKSMFTLFMHTHKLNEKIVELTNANSKMENKIKKLESLLKQNNIAVPKDSDDNDSASHTAQILKFSNDAKSAADNPGHVVKPQPLLMAGAGAGAGAGASAMILSKQEKTSP